MHIEHIIVGTDFSPQAEAAAKHALAIARRADAEVTLVHACPMVEPPSGRPSTQWSALMQRSMNKSRKQLEELRTVLKGQGAQISHALIDDAPDAGLVDSAERLGAGLIVVGTHGFTGVKHLLLGSVAERVVRRSPVSVLVARPLEHLNAGYRRILVPTDFSDSAAHALELALWLAAPGATVDVWHWWHSPYGGPLPDPESLRSEIEEDVRAAGEELLASHRDAGAVLGFELSEAPPVLGIQNRLTTGEGYDLVVMGSHGRRGVARWLLGSLAEATVRHAPCSVLVARAPASK